MANKNLFLIFGIVMSLSLSFFPMLAFGVPTVFFPLPVYMVIFGMIQFSWLVALVIFGLLWILFYDKDIKTFKKRSFSFNVSLLIITIIWFVCAKEYAITYQGRTHYLVCIFQNLVMNILLLFSWYKTTPEKTRFYVFIASIYLIAFAIPYFGELP